MTTEILQYIPQRPPIVMVSSLLEANDISAQTTLFISDDNIFVKNGLFTEPGIVEHIAQSAALQAGYGFVQAGKSVPIGYIAAIKGLTIHRLPSVRNELKTHVSIVNRVMNVTLVQAKVLVENQLIATCEMRVFIKDE